MDIRYLILSKDFVYVIGDGDGDGTKSSISKEECDLVVDILYCDDVITYADSRDIFDDLEEGQVYINQLDNGKYDIAVKGSVWIEENIIFNK